MGLGTGLLIAFVAMPIIEIWLLITVGGIIGALPTIGLVVLTAMVGMAMIRAQGIDAIRRAQVAANRSEPPIGPVVDGAFLLVAGALLLTPGFVTDAVGFICLVPQLRRIIASWVWTRYRDRIVVGNGSARRGGGDRGAARGGTVIEGEFEEVVRPGTDSEPAAGPPRDDSPWRDNGSP